MKFIILTSALLLLMAATSDARTMSLSEGSSSISAPAAIQCPSGTLRNIVEQFLQILTYTRGRLPASATELDEDCSEAQIPLTEIAQELESCFEDGSGIQNFLNTTLTTLYDQTCESTGNIYQDYVGNAACYSEHIYKMLDTCALELVEDIQNMNSSAGIRNKVCCTLDDVENCARTYLTAYCGTDADQIVTDFVDDLGRLSDVATYCSRNRVTSRLDCDLHSDIVSTRASLIECPQDQIATLIDDVVSIVDSVGLSTPYDEASLDLFCYDVVDNLEALIIDIEDCFNSNSLIIRGIEKTIRSDLTDVWEGFCWQNGTIRPYFVDNAECIHLNFLKLTSTCVRELVQDIDAIRAGTTGYNVLEEICCSLDDMETCAEGFLTNYCGSDSANVVSLAVDMIKGRLIPAMCSDNVLSNCSNLHAAATVGPTTDPCPSANRTCVDTFENSVVSTEDETYMCSIYDDFETCMKATTCPTPYYTNLPLEYQYLETDCNTAAALVTSFWLLIGVILFNIFSSRV